MKQTPSEMEVSPPDACEQLLGAIEAGEEEIAALPCPADSTLAVALALFGPEAIRQMLDEGLPYDDYFLLGTYQLETVQVVEGLLLSQEIGPRPFSVALTNDPTPQPVNLMRSSPSLTTTMEQYDVLEEMPHRPEPQLRGKAAARCSTPEQRLLAALGDLPQGWRSACGAISLLRGIQAHDSSGLKPAADKALLAAICYLTGPWRLTPLVSAPRWSQELEVSREDFSGAFEFLMDYLAGDGEMYRFVPKVPDSPLLADPEAEENLLGLVQDFLDTLEEESGAWDQEPYEDDEGEQGEIIPLFPEDN